MRPMLNVCWAPMLGAFSVLFEEFHDSKARNIPWLDSMHDRALTNLT